MTARLPVLPVTSRGDNHYGLPALPVADNGAPGFIHTRTEADRKRLAIKWSGPKPVPPAVGSRVTVTMNGIGPGVVLGYFIESNWVGLHVLPDNPPDWFVRQNKHRALYRDHALVFGAEVSY